MTDIFDTHYVIVEHMTNNEHLFEHLSTGEKWDFAREAAANFHKHYGRAEWDQNYFDVLYAFLEEEIKTV
jgi:hypothetical protein